MVPTVWAIRTPSEQKISNLPEGQTLSPLFLNLLANRGFQTSQEIVNFLNPHRGNLLDPFLMKGVDRAVLRIQKAAHQKEKVLIHGDYDVDGITGTAILALAFESLGISYETFLPERVRDGYGVSMEAIENAKRNGVRLLITVDCGISAREEIEKAREAGIEVIVLDHHRLPAEGLPPADAILNPLQEGCAYPFKELSAGGLAFKLAQALLGASAYDYFDLATLSTVADLAPLKGENRILVKEGLRLLSERKRIGIKAIAQAANLRAKEIKTSHVGFMIGPRINASGRMSSASIALRLLLTPHEREAQSLAQVLELENRRRQQEERKVTNEAISQVERTVNFARDSVLVVAQEGWHQGVIGIVASRLVEKFHRPSLVIALDGTKGKGSGRSIRSFHLFNALEAAREHLLEFGGHEQAAGFSMEAARIPALRQKLNEYTRATYGPEIFLKSIDIDLEISLTDLTPRFVKELELLEPFGIGNPKPVFLTRGLSVKKIIPAGKGRSSYRSQIWVSDGAMTYELAVSERSGIAFDFQNDSFFSLAYTVGIKRWEGEEVITLEAKDVKASS